MNTPPCYEATVEATRIVPEAIYPVCVSLTVYSFPPSTPNSRAPRPGQKPNRKKTK